MMCKLFTDNLSEKTVHRSGSSFSLAWENGFILDLSIQKSKMKITILKMFDIYLLL